MPVHGMTLQDCVQLKWDPQARHLRAAEVAGFGAVHERGDGDASIALPVPLQVELLPQAPHPIPVLRQGQGEVADVRTLEGALHRHSPAAQLP